MIKWYAYLMAIAFFFLKIQVNAQAPQKMSFQSVIRGTDGQLVKDRMVGIRISILQGSLTGGVVYSESHKSKTNANGLVSLEVGNGTIESGNFSTINWSTGLFFLQTEADISGGNTHTISGANQLLSVPYALYAKTAENGDKVVRITGAGATTVTGSYPDFTIMSSSNQYNPGAGISINGNIISNSAPDKTVTLTGTGATTVTGTYPNFLINSKDSITNYKAGNGIDINGITIINTAPDQPVNLTGAGTTNVSGVYPNFTITSTGGTVNYLAGTGIGINGLTITNTAPDKTVTLTGVGTTSITGTYPDFTITSTGGTTNYIAGAGIGINGTTITNTAPDKTVSITGTGTTTVTGSYPNFTINSTDTNTSYKAGIGIDINGSTINNSAPDKPINLNAGTGILINGVYPDYTISTTPTSQHFVGELFGGGIVYYTYDNGAHGLIASLTDLGNSSPWSTPQSNNSATSYYNGDSNTVAIVKVQGSTSTYAARLCSDYISSGFSDWYLPSLWELNLLYQNAFVVSFKLQNDGNPATTPMTSSASYWSSTEYDIGLAYMVYFPTGTPYFDYKDVNYNIRAIRRF